MSIPEIKGKTIKEIKVGDMDSISKTVTEYDVYAFAGITGDFNPAHVNEEYANQTMFKTRIAHGMLGVGIISAVLGTKLPGPGSIYIEQEVAFKKPVYIGDTITAVVEVMRINTEGKKPIIDFKTTCYNQNEEIVIDGIAKIIPPRE